MIDKPPGAVATKLHLLSYIEKKCVAISSSGTIRLDGVSTINRLERWVSSIQWMRKKSRDNLAHFTLIQFK